MNMVFAKTRELGEALMMSEEYTLMKQAEEKAMGNAQAAFLMGKLMESRQQVEQLLMEPECDPEQLRKLSDEMDRLQEQMQAVEDVKRLTEARENFSKLIAQVNKVLQFIVTGEMPEDENGEAGCTGSCESCGGKCHHLS